MLKEFTERDEKMSLDLLKNVLMKLPDCDSWTAQILKITTSKRSGTSYLCRDLLFSPDDRLHDFVKEVSEKYVKNEKSDFYKFTGISEYDGSTLGEMIYKLEADNLLIRDDLVKLIDAIGNPDVEINPLEIRAQAYLMKGIVTIDAEPHAVKLISMQNPITTLKHKFFRANGVFKEISDKVISLRTSIDVVILDQTVYMLTLAGEKLFDMERSYKATCTQKISEIEASNMVNNFDEFSNIASSGQNPRKFVSFNESHFEKLKNINSRRRLAKKFNIPLVGDQFDMTQKGAADKLVKLLCNRAMIDPFDEHPMEVAGSRKWE